MLHRFQLCLLLLAALALVCPQHASAQTVITGVTWTTTDGTSSGVVHEQTTSGSSYNVKYGNDSASLSSVSAGGTTYYTSGSGFNVYVRSVWANSGLINLNQAVDSINPGLMNLTGERVTGSSGTTLAEVLKAGTGYVGITDIFSNANGSTIERIDVVFDSAYTVRATDVIVLMGLGTVSGVRVATFQGANEWATWQYSLSGGTTITGAYSSVSLATPDGLTGAQDYVASNVVLSDVGSPTGSELGNAQSVPTQTTASLTGLVVTMAQLGLKDGDVIMGYSLMSSDTSGIGVYNIQDFSGYNKTTSGTAGSADFIGVWAPMSAGHPVPEPGLYGLLMGAGAAAWVFRRRSRRFALIKNGN